MNKPIRVLIADDHPLVRSGIRAVVADEPTITIVGEAADGQQLQTMIREVESDVLLMDLSMPGPPAVALVAFVHEHRPRTRVLILSAHDDDSLVRAMVAAGIQGYILKNEEIEQVAMAIQTVHSGATWFSSRVMGKMTMPLLAQRDAKALGLTEREEQILRCMARGWENARIASELFLAEQTVRNYTSRIYGKLGLASRSEAVIWARDRYLV